MNFAATALAALWDATRDLALPALGFAALALIVRGIAALRTARAARGEVGTNMALFVFDILAVTPALTIILTAATALIQRAGLTLAPETWSALPQWTVILIAVFAGDFIAYWRHRFEHLALIWPAHAVHHSDTAMTWTTGLRFHPFNRLTTSLIDMGLLAMLGFPPWAIAANALIRHYYGLFIHMDLPWTYGPLGRIFVSPAMHRWHHIRDAEGGGVNFATVFSVFDQALRTHHVPGPCTVPLGVRDEIGRGPLAQLVWPLKALWRTLTAPASQTPRSGEPGPIAGARSE